MSDSTRSTEQSPLVQKRFELELEFTQSLASPAYLHHLATQGYFQDPAFISFLRYLRYWKQPEYAKYIKFPHCLYFLELLCDNDTFRKELVNVPFRNFLHEQQFYNWQYRSRFLYGSGSDRIEDDKEKEVKIEIKDESKVDN